MSVVSPASSRHPAKQAAASNASPPASASRQATSRRQGKRQAARPPRSVVTPRRQRRPRQHQPTQACREQKLAARRKLLQASSGMGKSEQRADFLLPPRASARRCRLLRSSICAACRQRGLKRSGGPGAGQALLGAVAVLATQVE